MVKFKIARFRMGTNYGVDNRAPRREINLGEDTDHASIMRIFLETELLPQKIKIEKKISVREN